MNRSGRLRRSVLWRGGLVDAGRVPGVGLALAPVTAHGAVDGPAWDVPQQLRLSLATRRDSSLLPSASMTKR
jgi:hypothetical protein